MNAIAIQRKIDSNITVYFQIKTEFLPPEISLKEFSKALDEALIWVTVKPEKDNE